MSYHYGYSMIDTYGSFVSFAEITSISGPEFTLIADLVRGLDVKKDRLVQYASEHIIENTQSEIIEYSIPTKKWIETYLKYEKTCIDVEQQSVYIQTHNVYFQDDMSRNVRIDTNRYITGRINDISIGYNGFLQAHIENLQKFIDNGPGLGNEIIVYAEEDENAGLVDDVEVLEGFVTGSLSFESVIYREKIYFIVVPKDAKIAWNIDNLSVVLPPKTKVKCQGTVVYNFHGKYRDLTLVNVVT